LGKVTSYDTNKGCYDVFFAFDEEIHQRSRERIETLFASQDQIRKDNHYYWISIDGHTGDLDPNKKCNLKVWCKGHKHVQYFRYIADYFRIDALQNYLRENCTPAVYKLFSDHHKEIYGTQYVKFCFRPVQREWKIVLTQVDGTETIKSIEELKIELSDDKSKLKKINTMFYTWTEAKKKQSAWYFFETLEDMSKTSALYPFHLREETSTKEEKTSLIVPMCHYSFEEVTINKITYLICKTDGMYCGAAALFNASGELSRTVFEKLLLAHDESGTVQLGSLVQILDQESNLKMKFVKVTLKGCRTFMSLFRNILNERKGLYVITYAVGIENSHTIYWNSVDSYIIDSDDSTLLPLLYENEKDIERIVTQLHANVITEYVISVYEGRVLNVHSQARKRRKTSL